MPRSPQRRTRVVATIGPASSDPAVLSAMVAAGMDVARLPLAHGSIDDAVARFRLIRSAAPDVGILADLPGPKIRAAAFPEGGARVNAGDAIELVTAEGKDTASSATRLAVAHEDMVQQLIPGDRVLLGDGLVALQVEDRTGDRVTARVLSGGLLQGRPGVTAPAGRARLVTPTPEDLSRLEVLLSEGVDAVAVSFVRRAADMEAVRAVVGADGPLLMAKIETGEAVDDLDHILAASDAVMVARGDLGVRIPLEDVPHVQKMVIKAAVRFGRPVTTATQMLESMITSPAPTRAEVTDVANAVFDGTSAVMLSGETAIGLHPVAAVATMANIARRAEADFDHSAWGEGLGVQAVAGGQAERITATTTSAAWRASREGAAAIIACTRSGTTARVISRFRPEIPIVAATPSTRTARHLTLSWGVSTVSVPLSDSTDDIVWFAVKAAVEAGFAAAGDVVVVLAGSPTEPDPITDTMRIVSVH
ncbi:pyruvate kinase [Acidiferrimicrobium sp. IK]|uniref:pyruvate kinase n=1 Tax=Acidiferrimicrobium sp. IK TaxID=2871700 RepID=UPI0021CB01CC|nr:pyruvate kinase [Acidiferrimicrobium sp. IK]MCU4185306.1 pyruvate kinase [Acidiferrimicrobium sp. IK]